MIKRQTGLNIPSPFVHQPLKCHREESCVIVRGSSVQVCRTEADLQVRKSPNMLETQSRAGSVVTCWQMIVFGHHHLVQAGVRWETPERQQIQRGQGTTSFLHEVNACVHIRVLHSPSSPSDEIFLPDFCQKLPWCLDTCILRYNVKSGGVG